MLIFALGFNTLITRTAVVTLFAVFGGYLSSSTPGCAGCCRLFVIVSALWPIPPYPLFAAGGVILRARGTVQVRDLADYLFAVLRQFCRGGS